MYPNIFHRHIIDKNIWRTYIVFVKPWIIFDGDNTLWELEPLYDAARQEMCALVARHSDSAPHEIEAYQRNIDTKLFGQFGYNSQRFPNSFVETARHFLTDGDFIVLAKVVREIARKVFESDAPPSDGVAEVLVELDEHVNLSLLTSGDKKNQERKLSRFPYIDMFTGNVRIVEKKTTETLRQFCIDYKISFATGWVVGDSIRSDILPASELGIKAIHFSFPNWHEIETHGHELPTNTFQVSNFREIPKIVLPNLKANFPN